MASLTIGIPLIDSNELAMSRLFSTLESIRLSLLPVDYEVIVVSPKICLTSIDTILTNYQYTRSVAELSASHSGALNTMFLYSSKTHLLVLNPGDTLIDSHHIGPSIRDLDIDVVGVFNVCSDFFFVGHVQSSLEYSTVSRYIAKYGLRRYLNFPHQGIVLPVFYLQSLLTSGLEYSSCYSLRMDLDFLMQLRHRCPNLRLSLFNILLTYYPPGGKSMLMSNRIRFYQEEVNVHLENRLQPNPITLIRLYYWKMHNLYLNKHKNIQ
jgi:hypothetical protein